MTLNVHSRIQTLIEETNDAFFSYGQMNTDYAEFATLALSDFKAILSQPSMTSSELKQLLRAGLLRAGSVHCREEEPQKWASFIANHIAKAVNQR